MSSPVFNINNRHDIPSTANFSMATTFRYVRGFLDQDLHTGFLDQHPLTFWEAFKSSLGKWSKTKKKRLPTSFLTRAQKPIRSKLTMTDQKFKVKVAFMEARLGQTTKNKTDKIPTVFPEAKTALEDRNFCSSTSSHLHIWCERVCTLHPVNPRSIAGPATIVKGRALHPHLSPD